MSNETKLGQINRRRVQAMRDDNPDGELWRRSYAADVHWLLAGFEVGIWSRVLIFTPE